MSARGRMAVALVSTALMAYVAVGSLLGHVWGDNSYGQLTLFNEVIRLVIEGYVEPVNLDRAMAGANLGLTDALDGDSGYLSAEEFRAYQQPPSGNDADIGAVISRRFAFLFVVSVRPGSPAERAGIRGGDLIKTIDGRHTRPLTTPVGERLLRGAPGSVVKLKLLRDGNEAVDFAVVRERIAPTAPTGKILDEGTGYVKIPEFGPRAADDVRAELDKLRRSGARRLVLDLRGSAFGTPAEAVRVAELFLKGGVVAKLAGRHSSEQVFQADAARSAWELPMAVLIDFRTVGPAEIVAAALRDAERGPLVGRRSFGRAPVQKAVPLEEGGLVITVAKYVSPKGTAIHGKGVEPTVEVRGEPAEPGEEPDGDAALDKALQLLKDKETQQKAA